LKKGWHGLNAGYLTTLLCQKITSPIIPAKTIATIDAPKITLASRACCHGCRRGNNIFPNEFVIMIFPV